MRAYFTRMRFQSDNNLVERLRIPDLLGYKKGSSSDKNYAWVTDVTSKAAYDFAVCAPGKEERLPRGLVAELPSDDSSSSRRRRRSLYLEESLQSQLTSILDATSLVQPRHIACSGRYSGIRSPHRNDEDDISESLTDFQRQMHDGRATLKSCQGNRASEFGSNARQSTSYLSHVGYNNLKDADSLWDPMKKMNEWLCYVLLKLQDPSITK